ncbi:MAG: AarF/ABC1/UbiB kinase family protein [Intrasporangium sp.]|uniref:ABC1 kinase family protein n=1 Tax=Intrasporangium sp. TaxID=1925024 RepID=UPI0026474826|nr:AarF/ABC1/UbiB kinase family protein [Intrasporangium sp.]MDN5796553.1 AarF/ABC1/UbiB kinase family protein [Intrasporangium sp.]
MSSRADRYREIVDVLSIHGFGYLVGAAGLAGTFPFRRGLPGHERGRTYSQPEHLRLALEQLGPTFIKLGQVVSTRPDLLPQDYAAELALLQDAAAPVATVEIMAALAEELGSTARLSDLEAIPLASASIGQAHAATVDGAEVVVKVRRPGAIESVTRDLEIIADLAQRAQRRSQLARDYDLVAVVQDFAQTLRNELDYLAEGRNAERFARNFADETRVVFPKVIWDQTTARVLTLERIRGLKISDLQALDAAHIDRHELATLAARTLCKMVFEDGFFHADPHPGNFFVLDGGRLGIIDFGMVDEIDIDLRQRLVALLGAVISMSPERVVSALSALTTTSAPVDRSTLMADVDALVGRFGGRSLTELPVGALISDVNTILRRHHMRLPQHVALLLKTLIMAEGMGERLDPDFQFSEVIAPYAEQLLARNLDPLDITRRLVALSGTIAGLGRDAPQSLRNLMGAFEGGTLQVRLAEDDLRALAAANRQLGDRIVTALVAGAALDALGSLIGGSATRRATRIRLLAIGAVAAGTSYRALVGRPTADGKSRSGRRGPLVGQRLWRRPPSS